MKNVKADQYQKENHEAIGKLLAEIGEKVRAKRTDEPTWRSVDASLGYVREQLNEINLFLSDVKSEADYTRI